MLDVAIEKLRKNPDANPVMRSWEVKRKGNHDYSIVYKVFDSLLKMRIIVAMEPEVDKNEVKFTRNGLHVLRQELDFWNRIGNINYAVLERHRLETLTERVHQFERFFDSKV
jgi:hypothetical protein